MRSTGTLFLVATPVGNLSDFTIRAQETITNADTVACEDTRHSRILFEHYGLKPGKVVSFHAHNLERRTGELLRELISGKRVALLSDAGTPGISDPGAVLVKAAVESGVTVVPVPGASAPLLAVVTSGFPSHRFIYEGFLPRKKGLSTLFESWRQEARSVIFLESPKRIIKTLRKIADVTGGERKVCVAREITKLHEEFIRGEINAVIVDLESRPSVKGEITVVLAPAKF